jgi:crotonobetainyl-CoA:carnitine CoA-transferase CaiB-like acyl-CoA transferase
MDRMGFGETVVRELNNRMIYVSISGFGEHGPYAHKRVYDPVIQALSGATDIQANRATGKPAMFRIIIADKVTSLTAAQAITSALYFRERTGQGQHIKLSMLETMLAFFWPEGMGGLTYADKEYDVTRGQGTMDLIFEAQDGYLTAGAISDSEWQGVCQALNREDLIHDDRFATARARGRNADERKQIMADEIAKWRRDEILARFDEHDVPSAPLLSRMELMEHEQIRGNASITRTTWPGFGEVRQAMPAARFGVSPSEIKRPAPRLGEHSREILAGLGYDGNRCDTLISSGVVVAP